MDRLPLEIQTLYAEFVERLTALETRRSMGHAPGSIVYKSVRGETYCYFQYSEPGGGKRQVYLGRKDRILDRVVERYRAGKLQIAGDRDSIQRIASLLRVGGALATDPASSRVLQALSDTGLFHLGGVLVGTHAFVVIGNVLGVRWAGASLMTHDIDVAAAASIGIAVPEMRGDLPGVLESLEMGFLPVPQLDPRHPSTSFKVRGHGLRVDLLTPLIGRRTAGVTLIPRLNAAAQPLPFLDFLIVRPVRGAIVSGSGVMVSVPGPARFAFHKLIVAGDRGAAMHVKRAKDLRQAGQVFSILLDERPGDLQVALDDILERGAGWVRRIRSGLAALQKLDVESAKRIFSLLAKIRDTHQS